MTLSRIKAERIASDLLVSAHLEREAAAARGTRFLCLLYPNLRSVPPSQRRASLRSAWQLAIRGWFRWVQVVTGLLCVAGYVAMVVVMEDRRSSRLDWLLLFIVAALELIVRARRILSSRKVEPFRGGADS